MALESEQCFVIFIFHYMYISTSFIAAYSNMKFKGIVHFEINFWYVLAYLKGIKGHRCLCFRSSFNLIYFLVKPFVSISHIMEVYGVHLKAHAQRSPN